MSALPGPPAGDHEKQGSNSPGPLGKLPMLAGALGDDTPIALEQRLYDAFSIELLYKHGMHQVTIFATITDSTPATLAAIISLSENPTAPPPSPPATRHYFRI